MHINVKQVEQLRMLHGRDKRYHIDVGWSSVVLQVARNSIFVSCFEILTSIMNVQHYPLSDIAKAHLQNARL